MGAKESHVEKVRPEDWPRNSIQGRFLGRSDARMGLVPSVSLFAFASLYHYKILYCLTSQSALLLLHRPSNAKNVRIMSDMRADSIYGFG